MAKKIIQTGNSAAVTLPADFIKILNLRIGDPVEVSVNYAKGEIIFIFPSVRQLPLTVERK
ncbi:MAG TPA: AbrB/MazE/SpoVT family DNA-binding domain-containing protein [Patescibacteria group bacterium]|nr:AbrB/MazE/SpoVT family DNA-binding domain-containing protein [Patescibacteria group bacterium]